MEKTNLYLLMEQLDISGNELAIALAVDSSLISKWKNNNRPLSLKSPHLHKLVKYLLSPAPQNELRYIHIVNLLKKQYPDHEISDPVKMENLLSLWLTMNLNAPEFIEHDPLKEYPFHREGYHRHSMIYKGNKGRQAAILDLFEKAKSYKDPKNILLFTQENISWIINDPDFFEVWIKSLEESLALGHSITFIYWIDRPTKDLGDIFNQYLPLFLQGKIQAYYFPKYTELVHRVSLYLIEDEIGIFGMEGRKDRERYSIFFCDKNSLAHFQWVFDNNLKKCQELISCYKKSHYTNITNALESHHPGNQYSLIVTKKPCFLTLPENLFLELLDSLTLTKKSRQQLANFYYESMIQLPESNNNHIRFIYSKQAIEQALEQDFYVYDGLTKILQKEIEIPISFLYKHLNYQLEKCDNIDSYNIGLTYEPIKANLYIQDEGFFLTWNHKISDDILLFQEATLVKAIYNKYDKIWKEIPSIYKNNDMIREKLNLK